MIRFLKTDGVTAIDEQSEDGKPNARGNYGSRVDAFLAKRRKVAACLAARGGKYGNQLDAFLAKGRKRGRTAL